MAYVKADLTREVLGELFSLASGQTPNADDTTWVEQRIDATLATLAALNIFYIPDAEDVPDAAFNPLVTYLAEVCAPKFGRARDIQAQAIAEGQLRTLQRIGSGTGAMLTVDRALRPRRRFSIWNGA
jgi:hypothetical protein